MSFRVELSNADKEMIQNAKEIRGIYGDSQIKTNKMLIQKLEAIEKEHGVDAAIEAGEHIDFESSGLWLFMENLYARRNEQTVQTGEDNEL